MKHHAYATEVATKWKRPPRLSPRLRKKCRFKPSGKPVDPPVVYDFRQIIEDAPVVAAWRPGLGICIAPAFEAAGF